jgi:hypothetical protein
VGIKFVRAALLADAPVDSLLPPAALSVHHSFSLSPAAFSLISERFIQPFVVV